MAVQRTRPATLGNVVIYGLGLAGLARFVPGEGLLAAGLTPFLVGDAAKSAIDAAVLPSGWAVVNRVRGRDDGS